jgi:hypothetical protein
MRRKLIPISKSFRAVVAFVSLMSLSVALHAADSMKPEDLVARHLDAIGSKEARATAKTRVVQGTATYRILVGGAGSIEGKTGLVSDGHKSRFMMKFQNEYRGETFVGNDDKVQVAFANSNQSRSPLASFVQTYDAVIREGLFGGVLSTAWPLLDTSSRNPKLLYEGLKKVDGHQVHQLRYMPRKHTDAEILLYFDAETFRHVKTVYSIEIGNNVGATITESASKKPERSRLEERFSDFKTVDGLTLPSHWNIEFTRELPDGTTTVSQWDLKEDQISHNMGLDPRNFEIK